MGHADHRDVEHRRVLEQRGLDLGAVHVLAAADDHVLDAVDDVDEALVVEPGHVAACGTSRRRTPPGRLRLVPVALDDVRALDPELADLADGSVVAVGVDDLRRRRPATGTPTLSGLAR